MYRLVALDLDGTLLDSTGEVSDRAKKVIRRIQAQGILVIIFSGRPYASLKSFAKELDLNDYPGNL